MTVHFQPKEVHIKVQWGCIAGKWWGSMDRRPIVMLHGWQDNAGSFDKLIPTLPPQYSYLALDLPGHGRSSHYPPGMIYGTLTFIQTINHIQRHYKWDKVSFCSHSMGAIISQLYASLYPDRCDLLIALDGLLKPFSHSVDVAIEHTRKMGDDFLALDQLSRSGKEPPTYTHEEIVARWSKENGLAAQDLQHLINRGVRPSKTDPNRFYFSRDIRLKIMDFGSTTIPEEIHYKLQQRITAPFLFINANKTGEFVGFERYKKSLENLTAANPKFQYLTVAGDHHCHLTNPLLTNGLISDFINKHRLPSRM